MDCQINVGGKTFVFGLSPCPCEECPKRVEKKLREIHRIGSIEIDMAQGKVTITGSMVNSDTIIKKLKKIKKKVELVSEETASTDNEKGKEAVVRTDNMKRKMDTNPRIGSIGFDMAGGKVAITDSKVGPDTIIEELEKMKKAKLFNEEIASVDKGKGKQIGSSEPEVNKDQAALVVNRHFASNQVIDESSVIEKKDCHAKHWNKSELKKNAKRFTCDGCKEEGFGPRYLCENEKDYYEFHRDCMFPKLTISHELFKGVTFEFSREKPSPTCGNDIYPVRCEACGKEIHGYLYHCKSKGSSLHPRCINFKGTLRHESTILVLKREASTSYKCCVCGSSKLNSLSGREKRTHSGWSYVSESTNCQIHVNCIAQRLGEITHEAWKQRDIGDDDAAYRLVLDESLKKGIIKSESNGWPRGTRKFVKMIFTFARAIIAILLGDPIEILATVVVELFKN